MAPTKGAHGTVPPSEATPPMEVAMAHMLATRAMNVPTGEDAKFTLDSSDQTWFLVVAILCVALPGLFLIVRVYTKLAIVRSFEIADYFLFVALPLVIVEVVFGYEAVKWGSGVHQWHVTFGQLFQQLYWLNAAEITYCPLSFIVKMSILLQYLRLFAPERKKNPFMWYGAWGMIAGCFIFYTVFAFWTAFYCYPRQMIWNKLTPGGTCHDHSPIVIWQGSFNMASDIIILFLPSYELWKLNVPLARKIVITLLFGTGLLACAASAMRIAFTAKIEDVYRKADVSYNGFYLGLWTIVEIALAFVVACSLSLPRLIQAKGKKVKSALTSPFSTLRSATGSSPQGTLQSYSGKSAGLDATMERSLGAQRAPTHDMRSVGSLKEEKPPMSPEEREYLQAQQARMLNPIQENPYSPRPTRDPSPNPSSHYSSTRNSPEMASIEPLNLSHTPPTVPQPFAAHAHGRKLSNHQIEYVAAPEPWNSDPWSVDTTDIQARPPPTPVRQNSVPPRKPLAAASTIDARISRWPSQLDHNRAEQHRSLAPEPDSTSASEYYTPPILYPTTYSPVPVPSKTQNSHTSHWPSNPPYPTSTTQNKNNLVTPPATPPQESGELLRAVSYNKHERRPTSERMTIEEIEREMNMLQQFRFEEVKHSLESARNGMTGREREI